MLNKYVAVNLAAAALALNAYTQSPTIESFAPLAGCWERNQQGSFITEMWMKPAGTSMIGAGRTVKFGTTTDFEFLRIEQRDDSIYYIAKPRANVHETAFRLVKWSENAFVFENPEHDFPQRILYKVNGDSLSARIEGTRNGKTSGFDFPMTRTACR
jgi:hypothetical protein